jgi:anti-sigma-K factor RskA
MTGAPLTPHDADQAEAAEYVLGVQDLAERSATEARIRRDAGFAALVEAWEQRLSGLNEEFAESPAPNLLPALEARLFPQAPPAPRVPGRWRGLMIRWASGAAVALALVLVGMAMLLPPSQRLVATLATADARLAYEVRHFGNELEITRVAGTPAVAGRVHELWLIAPGAAPVSLGLLDQPTLTVAYPLPPEGWTLAVSIEPEGGSPIGSPTGPVILATVIGEDA